MPRRNGGDDIALEPLDRVLRRASLVTTVGAARVSTGPPISVMLRGCAGSLSAAMSETAATTAGAGWHTATTCVSGPRCCRSG